MNYFERLLEEKSKLDNSYDYFTQWEYDKKLYEDVLLGVRDYYSNYTDHGKNHSETILTNVLRMFGEEELKSLSSFDIWLLLESAYLHDCGMYISREEAEKTLKDEKFIFYFKEIYETPSHPMNKFTKTFKIVGDRIYYRDLEYELTLEYNMRFLISSYKRKSHAQDFKNVIFNKSKLLPERIYFILSIISRVHGEDFEEVMELPRKESGIGKEVGHPRFIACLLRMGDLLDIDNNRISPSIIKNIVDIIPSDSKLHLEKHRSISHLWIDKEKIEITATIDCGKESYEVAEITGNWFDCIREEYNNQLYKWKIIIPNNFKGVLPRLGELKIDIQDYEYIDSKYKPKFSVDTNNVLELLIGSSIYNRKESALREILQNSIDATYLRVFEEKKEKILEKQEISIKEIKELFKGKEIEVIIEQNTEKSKIDSEYNYWNISIKDRGIGINKDKLKYLIEAGSSYKDKAKIIQINDMPYWLKPSGNFGIGFQSIFLLTDKVRIESKFLYTQENIDVDLIKPCIEKQKSGNIYFRKVKFDYKQKVGTKISFEVKTLKETLSSLKKYRSHVMLKNNYFKYLDFDLQNELDIEIDNLIQEIIYINNYSFIDINVIKNGKNIKLKSKLKEYENDLIDYKEKYQIFCEDLKKKDECFRTLFMYRNQPIRMPSPYRYKYNFKYFLGRINIIGYSAKEVLNLSREIIKNDFHKREYKNILYKVYQKIKEKYLKRFSELEEIEKEIVAKFYLYYEDLLEEICKEKQSFFPEFVKEIEKIRQYFYQIPFVEKLTFEELKKEDEIFLEYSIELFGEYKLMGKNIKDDLLDILMNELLKNNEYEIIMEEIGKESRKLIFKKLKNESKKDNIKSYIDNKYDLREIIEEVLERSYIHCNKEFLDLKLKSSKIKISPLNLIPVRNIFFKDLNLEFCDKIIKENILLFPFYVEDDSRMIWNMKMRENYINFCYDNRANESLSKKEFSEKVDIFVDYLREEAKKIGITIQDEESEKDFKEEEYDQFN